MRKYCPKCRMWLPENIDECPVCHTKAAMKTSTMEKIFFAVLAVAIFLGALGLLFPNQLYRFIEAVDLEFVEIGNASEALLEKMGLANDSQALEDWDNRLRETIVNNVNSTPVRKLVSSKTSGGEDPYLKRVDALSNYVATNIKYKESKNFTDVQDVIRTFSGDDRAQVILLASMFNESNIDFKIDIVEDGREDGRGYHFRMLVQTTRSEDEVRKIITRRVKKSRMGLTGTKEKVWYVQDGESRWYVLDTTFGHMDQGESLIGAPWTFIGASDPYYANRSHYSLSVPIE
jgi:hypothetical protein